MTENNDTDKEPIESSPNSEAGKISEVNSPTVEPDKISSKHEAENMEVHHHPHLHHKPKKWKEYFLEFIMIFLAVTLGFFAESIRERITDNAKENEYIISMIEDAEMDTVNIHEAIIQNNIRILHLDSLATLCINYTGSLVEDSEIYRHYRYGLVHPAFVSPTERTIQQLKNAGGMRLIRNKAAVDSIILYDGMTKKLTDQQAYYELYQNNSIHPAFQLFNFQKFGFGISVPESKNGVKNKDYFKLVSNDKTKLIEFGNIILVYEGVVHFYEILLREMNKHAIQLIQALKEEYHLE